jgi:hypothetical protein
VIAEEEAQRILEDLEPDLMAMERAYEEMRPAWPKKTGNGSIE